MHRKVVTLLLVAVLLLIGLSANLSAQAQALKDVTLTLNWIPYGEHAPFFYGLDQGFYKAEGINLKVLPGGGSGKTVQLTGQGQTTFGWADTPAMIKGIAAGIPVKSIGVFLQKGPSSFEFFKDKGYKKVTDLKGIKLAVTPGDAVFQTLPAVLAANGMKVEDLTLVNVDAAGKIAALTEGKVDAIIGFFHDQAPTIENISGKEVSVILYADAGVNTLSNGLMVNTDLLKKDPDLVKAFLRASIRSWEEAVKNPDAAVAAMEKLAEGEPPVKVMTKQFALATTLLNTEASKGMRPGINVEKDWQATIDILAKYADLKNPGKPADYWDSSFAPEQKMAPQATMAATMAK